MGSKSRISSSNADDLRGAISGGVALPGDKLYDAGCRAWNGALARDMAAAAGAHGLVAALGNRGLSGGGETPRIGWAGLFPRQLRATGFNATRALMLRARLSRTLLDNAPLAAFAAAFLGCLSTAGLCALGITPCVASALVAALLCGQLLITRTHGLFADAFFPALYGGTFAGMTPVPSPGDSAFVHSWIVTSMSFGLLCVCCGLAFFVVTRLDNRSRRPFGSGYGGRLGAIAVVASFLFVAAVARFHAMPAQALDIGSWVTPEKFFACLAGTLATMIALRRASAVSAAARTFTASLIALIGLLTLHLGAPGDTRTLQAFYAGCFLGMSAPERFSGWFQPVFGALVLTAVLALLGALLPGIGGGLGFSAFVTVALLEALSSTTASLRAS